MGHKYFHTGSEYHAAKRATLLFFGSRTMPLNTSANLDDCAEHTSHLSLTATSTSNGCQAHYRCLSAPSGLWQTRRELNCTNCPLSQNASRTFVRIYLLVFLSQIWVVLSQIFCMSIIIMHPVCKGLWAIHSCAADVTPRPALSPPHAMCLSVLHWVYSLQL